MCEDKPVVIITGFGPYAGYSVNASWEAVKHINKNEIQNKFNIKLIQELVPMAYTCVDNIIPKLWIRYKPKLVIHVAVNKDTNCFRLESVAYNNFYKVRDINNECPANFTHPAQGAPVMQTKLNLEKIIREFPIDYKYNNNHIELHNDEHRNLGGYTYYSSLCFEDTCSLFVRVPDHNLITPEEAAGGLERVIELCLKQMNVTTPILSNVSFQEDTNTSKQVDRGLMQQINIRAQTLFNVPNCLLNTHKHWFILLLMLFFIFLLTFLLFIMIFY